MVDSGPSSLRGSYNFGAIENAGNADLTTIGSHLRNRFRSALSVENWNTQRASSSDPTTQMPTGLEDPLSDPISDPGSEDHPHPRISARKVQHSAFHQNQPLTFQTQADISNGISELTLNSAPQPQDLTMIPVQADLNLNTPAIVVHNQSDITVQNAPPTITSPSVTAYGNAIVSTVNWSQVEGPASDLSYGLNAYQGFRPESYSNIAYQSNLSLMSPGLIRFHNAGVMEDSSKPDGLMDTRNRTWDWDKVRDALTSSFTTFGATQPERMINIPTWPKWMDANKDGFLDSNQFDNYARLCADLVRVVNREYNLDVKYWEITNEKDDHYFVQFRKNSGWGGLKDGSKPDRLDELVTIYNKVATAMKQVDPTIQTGGPGIARSDLKPFYVPFIQGTVNNLDFFTYHFYPSGSASTSDQDVYDATNSIGNRTASMVEALQTASPNRPIPVFLGEYNISWTWETRDPRMTNHKGVVFDALSVVRALENGAGGTLAWNEKDGVYGKMGDQYNLRPGGNFLQLLNQHLVGDRIATTTSNEEAVTTFAVNNTALNSRSYLVINHSGSPQWMQTNFAGWEPVNPSVTRYEISASGYSQTASNWQNVHSGIAIPADSVTLLTFP